MVISLLGCKQKKSTENEAEETVVENTIQYVKELGIWAVVNEEDIGKDLKELDKDSKEYFDFELNLLLFLKRK